MRREPRRVVRMGRIIDGIIGGMRTCRPRARRRCSFRIVVRRCEEVLKEVVERGGERRCERIVLWVSSIGWKRIRAIKEPGGKQTYNIKRG